MVQRMIWNQTAYFGAGCVSVVPSTHHGVFLLAWPPASPSPASFSSRFLSSSAARPNRAPEECSGRIG